MTVGQHVWISSAVVGMPAIEDSMARADAVVVLEQMYAALPSLHCRGKCASSCVPIDMSDTERERVRRHTGITIAPRGEATSGSCQALTFLGTCAAYEVRPMICRLWGVSASMPCPHGCRPVGELLDDGTTVLLLLEAFEAGGSGWSELLPVMREMVGDPALHPALGRLLRGDPGAQAEITAAVLAWRRASAAPDPMPTGRRRRRGRRPS